MKIIEVKGFKGFMVFAFVTAALLIVGLGLPIGLVWITWNALVGDVFHGPMIGLLQAALLAMILAIAFKLVFQPQFGFQFKRVDSVEDLEEHLPKK